MSDVQQLPPVDPAGTAAAILARVVRIETRLVRFMENLGYDANGEPILPPEHDERRIAACLKACDGIGTEALEQYVRKNPPYKTHRAFPTFTS